MDMKILNKRVKFFFIVAAVGVLFLLIRGWLHQSAWKDSEGMFVLDPRIDITTTNRTHLRWAPTIEYVCQDNYFILYEKSGDSFFIAAGQQPLARAQAECRPTDVGYECFADITGVMQENKSYVFQAYSSRCGDGIERVSKIQEYFNAPLQVETESASTDQAS